MRGPISLHCYVGGKCLAAGTTRVSTRTNPDKLAQLMPLPLSQARGDPLRHLLASAVMVAIGHRLHLITISVAFGFSAGHYVCLPSRDTFVPFLLDWISARPGCRFDSDVCTTVSTLPQARSNDQCAGSSFHTDLSIMFVSIV